MAFNLVYSDATQLAELIRIRKVTAVQVMQAHLDRIEAVNPDLNAIVTINSKALEQAKEADGALTSGKILGPLHGVPFTVKDSIDTAGVPTQRGSPIFEDRIPETDATSVSRMKAAGGILLAKTNLPEFSYSTESDNLLTGRSNNPWNLSKTPGGSSGGESAAIAAGLSPLGLGTDLAISVRGPAAQTGIVALKATHGRVPMTGIWPRAPRRFWHVGPMARSIRDLELAYSILAGPDGQDAYSTIISGQVVKPQDRKLRVGWMTGPGFGPVDPEVRSTVKAAAEALETTGCIVESVHIPALERDFALDVFMKLHVNEMKPAFQEAVQGQPESHIFKIARNMLSRTETSAEDFVKAEQAADRLKDGFAEYFESFDIFLCPVLPTPAHKHNVSELTIDGQTVSVLNVMAATVPLNVTGLPGLSMRFGASTDGLPIGVQLVSRWSDEATLLRVARLLEG
ncbi:Asp-tRNAAsn/Glu-tRNAGln amidotransferase A subunit and related amidase, partial [Fusarium austroafricanum]